MLATTVPSWANWFRTMKSWGSWLRSSWKREFKAQTSLQLEVINRSRVTSTTATNQTGDRQIPILRLTEKCKLVKATNSIAPLGWRTKTAALELAPVQFMSTRSCSCNYKNALNWSNAKTKILSFSRWRSIVSINVFAAMCLLKINSTKTLWEWSDLSTRKSRNSRLNWGKLRTKSYSSSSVSRSQNRYSRQWKVGLTRTHHVWLSWQSRTLF